MDQSIRMRITANGMTFCGKCSSGGRVKIVEEIKVVKIILLMLFLGNRRI